MPSKRSFTLGDYDPATRSVPVLASTTNPVEGEALVSWDLTRFLKNPVVLWAHDSCSMPVGDAREVIFSPDAGLAMRIFFGSPIANPFIVQLEEAVRTKLIRGVSVGFEPGPDVASVVDGEPAIVRGPNVLCEVSFVPVPKDEDAGTSALHSDARDGDAVDHLDAATMSKVQWTPFGAARIKTRIARIGVLDYPGRRELREPSEVFKPSSLESLKGVPVVDITDHTDFVRPHDFRRKVLGHVEDDVHVDGDFITATLRIEDHETIEAIKRGDRLDVSAGYHAPTTRRAGVFRGERYDHVQRDIVYNHVALCPPGRGRAGAEVGLKLDARNAREVGAGADARRTIESSGSRAIRA